MWQAELAEATIVMGRKLLPAAQRTALELSNLWDEGLKLPGIFKGKTAQALPELSLETTATQAAGIKTAAKPVDIHVSSSPNLQLHDVAPGQSWKPKGLWASEKLEWVPTTRPLSRQDAVKGFAYQVDTGNARMLEVATPEQFQDLIRRYGKLSEFPSRYESKISLSNLELGKISRASDSELMAFQNSDINWNEVAKKFDGIRFSGYREIKSSVPVPHWFDGLDLRSSVTWNNVDRVKVTPLGKVPSYYEPGFQEKLKALIGKATGA